ncbi:MAG: hypothetical protein J0H89_11085, partial [Rhizobiales bacterium]|nr:hypothetical protein [Hyphomicrobiales bacterium]
MIDPTLLERASLLGGELIVGRPLADKSRMKTPGLRGKSGGPVERSARRHFGDFNLEAQLDFGQ